MVGAFPVTMDVVAWYKSKRVPFLDTEVYIHNDGFINTPLCHPGHITKNIPYSLAFRLKMICSKDEEFIKNLNDLNSDLRKRGYTQRYLDLAFERVIALERTETLKKVHKLPNQESVLALTYHPSLPQITKITKKHCQVMVDSDVHLKNCFQKPPIIAYRWMKNLSDLLIRARIPKPYNIQPRQMGFVKCNKGCIVCSHAENTRTHELLDKSKSFNINNLISCDTKNIIYRVRCKKCTPVHLYRRVR